MIKGGFWFEIKPPYTYSLYDDIHSVTDGCVSVLHRGPVDKYLGVVSAWSDVFHCVDV